MAKHDGHATVASFDSQYWHCGESEEIAAPQFGQLSVCASIRRSRYSLAFQVRRQPRKIFLMWFGLDLKRIPFKFHKRGC
jgi:hypothetical protein